jgi:hypothetical protein
MVKLPFFIAAVIATMPIALGGANAQTACTAGPTPLTNIGAVHGYSDKPAEFGAPGTSVVATTTWKETRSCTDFSTDPPTVTVLGSIDLYEKKYVSGPGHSKFEEKNPIVFTCEATGTLSGECVP